MKVIWTPEAEAERSHIGDHIAADKPRAAIRMDFLFQAAALRLADFPEIGRPGLIPGTRELFPHPRYRMVYEIRDDRVWITSLVHTSRKWPPADDTDEGAT